MSLKEEASRESQDILEGLQIWEHLGDPPADLEEATVARKVWTSLLRLLPLQPDFGAAEAPKLLKIDGWTACEY